MAAVTMMKFPMNPLPHQRNEIDEAIEILHRLTLFITDLDLDPLLMKVSNKINQRRLDNLFENGNCSILSLIFLQTLTILLLGKI